MSRLQSRQVERASEVIGVRVFEVHTDEETGEITHVEKLSRAALSRNAEGQTVYSTIEVIETRPVGSGDPRNVIEPWPSAVVSEPEPDAEDEPSRDVIDDDKP